MEWETHHDLPFLDVLINTDPHLTLTSVYLERTLNFPGLLSNNCYLGFSPFTLKIGINLLEP